MVYPVDRIDLSNIYKLPCLSFPNFLLPPHHNRFVAPRLGFTREESLLASNANIGGPATAASLAATKGWTQLVAPGILAGLLGNVIATFVGLGLSQVFRAIH